MTKKEHYESPSMEVVELKLQSCLLAGSQYGTINETGDLNGFEDSWN